MKRIAKYAQGDVVLLKLDNKTYAGKVERSEVFDIVKKKALKQDGPFTTTLSGETYIEEEIYYRISCRVEDGTKLSLLLKEDDLISVVNFELLEIKD